MIKLLMAMSYGEYLLIDLDGGKERLLQTMLGVQNRPDEPMACEWLAP
jgi:hypothetical protein